MKNYIYVLLLSFSMVLAQPVESSANRPRVSVGAELTTWQKVDAYSFLAFVTIICAATPLFALDSALPQSVSFETRRKLGLLAAASGVATEYYVLKDADVIHSYLNHKNSIDSLCFYADVLWRMLHGW